jgi:hypothetical protein
MVFTTIRNTIAIWLLVFIVGCSGRQPQSGEWRLAEASTSREEWQWTNGMAWPINAIRPELVMLSGMQITAHTDEGQIIIRADKGFERRYSWDGATRSATLLPRKKRWYGSQGIYFPGAGDNWKENNGITRGVLEEGILWFKTADDALSWINRARSAGMAYVYNDDGLTVGWHKVIPRKQIDVAVWQIMIGGQKPQKLPGSQNNRLSVLISENQ